MKPFFKGFTYLNSPVSVTVRQFQLDSTYRSHQLFIACQVKSLGLCFLSFPNVDDPSALAFYLPKEMGNIQWPISHIYSVARCKQENPLFSYIFTSSYIQGYQKQRNIFTHRKVVLPSWLRSHVGPLSTQFIVRKLK